MKSIEQKYRQLDERHIIKSVIRVFSFMLCWSCSNEELKTHQPKKFAFKISGQSFFVHVRA